MHHREDTDLAGAKRIEKTIGEAAKELAPDGSTDNWRRLAIGKKLGERCIHRIQEGGPKGGGLHP